MGKIRLDQLLTKREMFTSRRQAQAAIIAAEVLVDGREIRKPGFLVQENSEVKLKARPEPRSSMEEQGRRVPLENYVSRGGLKLEKALHDFKVAVKDRVVLDGGASTGGFTDCLLKHGAKKVIAVDVGYGQLAWRLRQNPQVEVHERENLRYLTPAKISELAELATLDLSFISLTKVMPAVLACLRKKGEILALVKPQFEVGKSKVGKGGVVKNPQLHEEVLLNLANHFLTKDLSLLGITASPLLGPKGNIEFWLYLSKKDWSQTSSNKKRSAFRVQRSEKIKKVAQNAGRGTQNAMLSEGEDWHQRNKMPQSRFGLKKEELDNYVRKVVAEAHRELAKGK